MKKLKINKYTGDTGLITDDEIEKIKESYGKFQRKYKRHFLLKQFALWGSSLIAIGHAVIHLIAHLLGLPCP